MDDIMKLMTVEEIQKFAEEMFKAINTRIDERFIKSENIEEDTSLLEE